MWFLWNVLVNKDSCLAAFMAKTVLKNFKKWVKMLYRILSSHLWRNWYYLSLNKIYVLFLLKYNFLFKETMRKQWFWISFGSRHVKIIKISLYIYIINIFLLSIFLLGVSPSTIITYTCEWESSLCEWYFDNYF